MRTLGVKRGRIRDGPEKSEMMPRNSGMELSGLETASPLFRGRSWGVREKDVGKPLYVAT